MKRLRSLVWLAAVSAGCVHGAPPLTPVAPAVTQMLVSVRTAGGTLPVHVVGTVNIWGEATNRPGLNLPTGVRFAVPYGVGATVCMNADTLAQACEDVTTGPTAPEIVMHPAHVDPSTFSLPQLAAIRGAMWGTRWNGGYGPRPGQPDNILALAFYQLYPPDERARMLAIYTSRGYTHAVTGPVSGGDCYHGQYPCHDPSNPGWLPQDGAPSQAQWDSYLDRLQEMWDASVAPIFFIHPDNWTFEQTRDTFTPLLQQPRAQQLLRIVVPSGWEPAKYEWSSCTWARYGQWARQVLPNALVLLHTVSDVDAPVGVDDLCNDNTNTNVTADGWARVAPYVHGWLIQNGPYPAAPDQDAEHKQPFCDQFSADTPHTVAWEFAHNGWPQFSAWGEQRIRLYNAENTAYSSYWANLPEEASRAWGDLAMACGSDGYMDGGTVPVPVR